MKMIYCKARRVLIILCFLLSISSLQLFTKESKHRLKATKVGGTFIQINFEDVKEINKKIEGKEDKKMAFMI